MTPGHVVEIAQHALLITVMMAAPLLGAALLTGLAVGLFQAATQINEQTLSFIPKLLAIFAALVISAPWLLATFIEYMRSIFLELIPRVVGA